MIMMFKRSIIKRIFYVGGGSVLVLGGSFFGWNQAMEWRFKKRLINIAKADPSLNVRPTTALPTRSEIVDALMNTPEFDVLIIGGGATGAGCAVDAQTRGLSTALIELDDFSSGTSSRSTKLIHGGVRYLEAAFKKLDIEQYRMVKEALYERANLIEVAPHISSALPIMVPIYSWWKFVYYYAGVKMYDLVAWSRPLKASYSIGASKTLELFPMLKKENLKGALVYFDGQQNDSRMNIALILTAIRKGAQCINHVAVVKLLKGVNDEGKVVVQGAKVRDETTGKEWDIKAKAVINATGAFCDEIRSMDDPTCDKLVVPSQGTHIVLPGYYSPAKTGLLDPSTSDGRVIFFLPWERMTIAGTTDSPCGITHSPAPAEGEVEFILGEIRNYLAKDVTVRRGDVLSAWAGIRPLVRDPTKKDTASLARNHIIVVSDSNLITVAGGKWTTYRHMAEETVDKLIDVCKLKPTNSCVTPGLLLEGAHNYSPLLYMHLVQDYGLEVDVAENLAHTYGDRAYSVAKLAKLTGKRWPIVGVRLHEELPYLEAEVLYAMKEYALTAVDVLARRLRLAFLNTYAAEEALPKVIEIMAKELKWDAKEQKRQKEIAIKFLQIEMGAAAKQRALEDAPLDLNKTEKEWAIQRFNMLDRDRKGHITINDLRKHFKDHNEKIDERLLHELLNEVDLNKNGEIELMEFLQLYSGIKRGAVSHSRLAKYLDSADDVSDQQRKIIVDRSGGGL